MIDRTRIHELISVYLLLLWVLCVRVVGLGVGYRLTCTQSGMRWVWLTGWVNYSVRKLLWTGMCRSVGMVHWLCEPGGELVRRPANHSLRVRQADVEIQRSTARQTNLTDWRVFSQALYISLTWIMSLAPKTRTSLHLNNDSQICSQITSQNWWQTGCQSVPQIASPCQSLSSICWWVGRIALVTSTTHIIVH